MYIINQCIISLYRALSQSEAAIRPTAGLTSPVVDIHAIIIEKHLLTDPPPCQGGKTLYTEVIPLPKNRPVKTVANNRKAFHDYFILDRFEAGIELFGTEVKSIRMGNVNLKDSFCVIKNGEIFAHGMHISPYEKGNIFNRDPMRPKRLLMHKREIMRLYGKIKQEGLTLIPLSVYFNSDGRVKLELGLAKGKKLYDKREALARRDSDRDIERIKKERNL